MQKIKMSEIRAKFPMYGDVSDQELLSAVRRKYYDDIPVGQFVSAVEFDTERDRLRKEMLDGMSGTEKFFAGMGKSATDLLRTGKRVANMVGIGDYDQKAAQADKELDAPLMSTGAGTAGAVVGDLMLTAVPGYKLQQGITKGVTTAAKVLPRAATSLGVAAPYLGAAGSGAVVGAATNPADLSGGAVTGAAAGTAGELAGRVVSGAYSGLKGALEPLTEKGRERVLKRTLERFAADPDAVRAGAQNARVLVPGATPTLAEATMDPGIAQLQRSAATASPEVASALAEARARQVGAYRNALGDIAGDDAAMAAALGNREGAAQSLYGRAFESDAMRRDLAAQGVRSSSPFSGVGGAVPAPDLATPGLRTLMERPMFKQAAQQAKALAANRGVDIGNPIESLQGLHYIKLALDDMANPEAATAMGRNAYGAVNDMRAALTRELETISPMYGAARQTYADMSKPINQMEVARMLRDKALPALTDLNPGLARVNANSYAQALRNADQTVRQATGMKSLGMADVMDASQLRTINNVGEDMGRYAAAQELARVPGSPTAQYLGGQNAIRQMLGPLGLPQGAADAAAGKIMSGVLNLPYKLTESQTQQLLASVLTDPQVAAKILQTPDPRTIAEILRPYAAQLAVQVDIQE